MTTIVYVGQGCGSNADCVEPDLSCFHAFGLYGLPGGYCSKSCGGKVACPTGSECVSTLYGNFCLNQCETNNNTGNGRGTCRPGYACCQSVGACGLDLFCGD
jgi:hypothetical protein